MFPINIAGNAVPGKKDLFAACVKHNVGLVAMKPFAGGKLLQEWQEAEMNKWQVGIDKKAVRRSVAVTPVQCLSYVLAQLGMSTIVPGARTSTSSTRRYRTSRRRRSSATSRTILRLQRLRRGRVRLLQPLPAVSPESTSARRSVPRPREGPQQAGGARRVQREGTNASDCGNVARASSAARSTWTS